MDSIKPGSWLHDLVEVYNELGGQARYSEVYPLAEERRLRRGASWTAEAKASIRRTVEDHAESSSNFRGRAVFYSVNGHGKGVWALLPDYLSVSPLELLPNPPAYREGVEGIARERTYLRRTRDPRLVQARKELDDYTCQVCAFRLMTEGGGFIIDVHHLRPLGHVKDAVVTSIEDLVCLCPTCHRIAHSRTDRPLTLDEMRDII